MIYAIWESNKKNERIIHEISSNRNGSFLAISSIDEVINEEKVTLFVDENLIELDFFSRNKAICDKIEKLEWVLILIGHKKKFKPLPYLAKRIKSTIKDLRELEIALDILEKTRNNPLSRETTFNKKMNRLFYIYYCLTDRDSVTYEEIAFVSGVSKRTFQRDIKTLKEVLATQNIICNEYEKKYTIEYI